MTRPRARPARSKRIEAEVDPALEGVEEPEADEPLDPEVFEPVEVADALLPLPAAAVPLALDDADEEEDEPEAPESV